MSAILATDEEWSIISSSDLEELSGSTTDSGNECISAQFGLEIPQMKQEPIDSIKASGLLNLESTITPIEPGMGRMDRASKLKKPVAYGTVSRNGQSFCGFARCTNQISNGYKAWANKLKVTSRAVFGVIFSSHLFKVKQRARSPSPLSRWEATTLKILLFLEKVQYKLIIYALLWFACAFAIYYGLGHVQHAKPLAETSIFSQQYARLKNNLSGRFANVENNAPIGIEALRLKEIYKKAKSVFCPESTAVAFDQTQSNWITKLCGPCPRKKPAVLSVGDRTKIYWRQIQRSTKDLASPLALSDRAQFLVSKAQAPVESMLQSLFSSLASIKTGTVAAKAEVQTIAVALQQHVNSSWVPHSDTLWHGLATTRSRFYEAAHEIPTVQWSFWNSVFSTSHLKRGQQQFDTVAKHSYLTFKRVISSFGSA